MNLVYDSNPENDPEHDSEHDLACDSESTSGSELEHGWTLLAATSSAADTHAVGQAFAEQLRAGDVVLLSGDLGAGKTQFVQGIAAGLGADEMPISPTFNIVLTYGSGRLPLHHFDLYRLETRAQLDDIGLPEYLDGGGVCCIEWAEKFPGAFHGARRILEVSIVKVPGRSSDAREIRMRAPERFVAGKTTPVGTRLSASAAPAGADVLVGVPAGFTAPAKNPSSDPAPAPAAAHADASDVQDPLVLAFDTANEVVAIALGTLEAAGEGAEEPSGDGAGEPAGEDAVPHAVPHAAPHVAPHPAPRIRLIASREIQAHRASNTTLVPAVNDLLAEHGIDRSRIACVCVGRGPGSFTGVRIAMATAKGIASALGVGLVGVSTLNAIAWNAWAAGVRGNVLVLADAMRKEVYPVSFTLSDDGARRQTADRVVKATDLASELAPKTSFADPGTPIGPGTPICPGTLPAEPAPPLAPRILGDALVKYRDLFEPLAADVLPRELWDVTGRGLLLALQAAWCEGAADPLDPARHDPAFALPVYTRLSDAEENERAKLAQGDRATKDLASGVQGGAQGRAQGRVQGGAQGRDTMHSQASLVAPPDGQGVSYHPLDAAHVEDVAALEAEAMGTDAWSARLVADELGQRNRSWWIAEADGALVGYAGGLVVDGDLQILKVAVEPAHRHRGIARMLLARVAEDARNLGAATCSLEVRAGNAGAQAFYAALGLQALGTRPRYYSDREDALIMAGPLPTAAAASAGRAAEHGAAPAAARDVAGMHLQHLDYGNAGEGGVRIKKSAKASIADSFTCQVVSVGTLSERPSAAVGGRSESVPTGVIVPVRKPAYDTATSTATGATNTVRILAIESSCDETAAAVIQGSAGDGEGDDGAGELAEQLLSDVVASQIDFHARFGGVVPEIASRKHIEAICGVCEEALATAISDSPDDFDPAVPGAADDSHAFASDSPNDSHVVVGTPLRASAGNDASPERDVLPEGGDRRAPSATFTPNSALTWRDLDAIAVTRAPGLLGALVVGVAFAKGAAWALDIPLIGVNHLEGHLYANKLGIPEGQPPFAPPAVVSLVSGGNTMLVHMRGWGDYEVLGETIDDAVGEAFDKVAKALGLGYPGGPVISREAARGNPDAIAFPRAMMHSHDLRFSLSGLKTAVVNYINTERNASRELNVPDIAASFQQAVIDVQVAKAKTALVQTGAPTFCLGGGVAANPALRAAYEQMCARQGVRLIMPPLSSCGDNAGMIALVALDHYRAGRFLPLNADAAAHEPLPKRNAKR